MAAKEDERGAVMGKLVRDKIPEIIKNDGTSDELLKADGGVTSLSAITSDITQAAETAAGAVQSIAQLNTTLTESYATKDYANQQASDKASTAASALKTELLGDSDKDSAGVNTFAGVYKQIETITGTGGSGGSLTELATNLSTLSNHVKGIYGKDLPTGTGTITYEATITGLKDSQANMVTTGSTALTSNTIILGNGSKTVKTSAFTISAASSDTTDDNKTLITKKLVDSAIKDAKDALIGTGSSDTTDTIKKAQTTADGAVASINTITNGSTINTFGGVESALAEKISGSATDGQIVIGAGNKSIETSGKTITTSVTNTDDTIPTSGAVYDAIDAASATITGNYSTKGNANAGTVVTRSANGQINSEKFAITSGENIKATYQYNSATDCIELVWS